MSRITLASGDKLEVKEDAAAVAHTCMTTAPSRGLARFTGPDDEVVFVNPALVTMVHA